MALLTTGINCMILNTGMNQGQVWTGSKRLSTFNHFQRLSKTHSQDCFQSVDAHVFECVWKATRVCLSIHWPKAWRYGTCFKKATKTTHSIYTMLCQNIGVTILIVSVCFLSRSLISICALSVTCLGWPFVVGSLCRNYTTWDMGSFLHELYSTRHTSWVIFTRKVI